MSDDALCSVLFNRQAQQEIEAAERELEKKRLQRRPECCGDAGLSSNPDDPENRDRQLPGPREH